MSCAFEAVADSAFWILVSSPFVGVGLGLARVALPWERILLKNDVTLEWVADVSLHAAFYSSAFAALLGVQNCSPRWASWGFIVLLAAICLTASWLCLWQRSRGPFERPE